MLSQESQYFVCGNRRVTYDRILVRLLYESLVDVRLTLMKFQMISRFLSIFEIYVILCWSITHYLSQYHVKIFKYKGFGMMFSHLVRFNVTSANVVTNGHINIQALSLSTRDMITNSRLS